jgi:hypothetical protein
MNEHLLYFHNVYVVLPYNIPIANFHWHMCNRSQEHMIRGLVDINFG